MRITIAKLATGETAHVRQGAGQEHPDWVLQQVAAESEAGLQRYLEGLNVEMWYGDDGEHLGSDICGMEMFR